MSWNLEEAIAYYQKQGSDQNVLISLLREVQQENGGSVPVAATAAIAEAFGAKQSYVLAVIRRIPSLRLSDKHTLELCAGPNCGKQTALAAAAEEICAAKAGRITLRYVPCMRMCGKGPNIRWDGTLYHQADAALLKSLTESV